MPTTVGVPARQGPHHGLLLLLCGPSGPTVKVTEKERPWGVPLIARTNHLSARPRQRLTGNPWVPGSYDPPVSLVLGSCGGSLRPQRWLTRVFMSGISLVSERRSAQRLGTEFQPPLRTRSLNSRPWTTSGPCGPPTMGHPTSGSYGPPHGGRSRKTCFHCRLVPMVG